MPYSSGDRAAPPTNSQWSYLLILQLYNLIVYLVVVLICNGDDSEMTHVGFKMCALVIDYDSNFLIMKLSTLVLMVFFINFDT